MKKLMVGLLAVTFAMSLTAFAQQDTMSQDHSMPRHKRTPEPRLR